VRPLPRWRLRLLLLPILLRFLGAISGSAHHELLGGCRERGGEIWEDWGSSRGWRWSAVVFGGFWRLLANCRLEAQFLLNVTAGLNNQRLGAVLLFWSWRVISRNVWKLRGHLMDYLDKIFN
jgi:hypothetical protein